jgi:competence protein ComEC
MTLIYLCLAWIAGLLLARALGGAPTLWGALAGAALLGWLVAVSRRLPRRAVACLLFFLLGGWRYVLAQPQLNAFHLAYYNDSGVVSVRGFVSAAPSVRATYTQLEVQAEEVERQGARHVVQGKMVLNVPSTPRWQYGDRLIITGALETPPIYPDFSYREYLAGRGVHSLMTRPRLAALEGTQGSAAWRALLAAQDSLRGVIEAILPQPEAGLLNGILLGLGHTLPDDVNDAFRAAGLTHLLVVSGYNLSLMAQAALLLNRHLLRRWAALWASLAAVLLYAALVGPTPPVERAALMGGLFILAQLVGRRAHALTSLAMASLVVTAVNPLLLWGSSLQLSFAATVALIAVEPPLARWLLARAGASDAPSWKRSLAAFFLTTVVAQMVTLPLLWRDFGQLSLIAPLANALVLPAQPPIMALGTAALALGTLWLPLGRVVGWLAWVPLRYTLVVAQGLGGLSWASVELPRLAPGAAVALYAALTVALWPRLRRRVLATLRGVASGPRWGKAGILALALVTVLTWAAVLALPDGRLHFSFLDVGQGDAILLRTPGGRTVLVDGGPDPLLLRARLGQILPFWQRTLDLVVVTHADQDHLAGLVPLLEQYRVEQVLQAPLVAQSQEAALWREALRRRGTPVRLATRGMQVALGPALRLEVLHPSAEGAAGKDDNREGIVLSVVMGQARALLTADMDAEVEAELIATGVPLQASLLKVAHHGAATASTARFLSAVAPQLAVISVGKNRFGHPHPATLQRLEEAGSRTLRTDQQGTIEIITDGRRYWVNPQRPAP